MRIATYNIWNNARGGGQRTKQIIDEINSVDADIIGLQEVTPDVFRELSEGLEYPYRCFHTYRDEDEGLAYLGKHPLEDEFFLGKSEKYSYSAALNIIFKSGGFTFSVTNLHLPWDSILEKEKQTVIIDGFIKEQKNKADFFVLLGDFNCTLNSSVHNYLLGEQSLLGHEAKPCWFDLGSTYAAINGIQNKATLDFQKNPRWSDNTTEIPAVYDRILIMNSYGRKFDEIINKVDIFGTSVSEQTGLAASDHYGVYADIEFVL